MSKDEAGEFLLPPFVVPGYRWNAEGLPKYGKKWVLRKADNPIQDGRLKGKVRVIPIQCTAPGMRLSIENDPGSDRICGATMFIAVDLDGAAELVHGDDDHVHRAIQRCTPHGTAGCRLCPTTPPVCTEELGCNLFGLIKVQQGLDYGKANCPESNVMGNPTILKSLINAIAAKESKNAFVCGNLMRTASSARVRCCAANPPCHCLKRCCSGKNLTSPVSDPRTRFPTSSTWSGLRSTASPAARRGCAA